MEVEVGTRRPHHAAAVGVGVADVELAVRRHPGEATSGGGGAIEVAGALVVGDEPHPLSYPDGAGDVAVESLEERLEVSVTVGVEPQPARETPSIAFPPGRLATVDGHHRGAVGPPGDPGGVAPRLGNRAGAVDPDPEQAPRAGEGLPSVGADPHRRTVRLPRQHRRHATEMGEAGRLPSLGGDQPHILVAFVGGRVGEVGPVR